MEKTLAVALKALVVWCAADRAAALTATTTPTTWAALGTPPSLRNRIAEVIGSPEVPPTAIQASAYAQIRDGADVVLHSETGSGKTLAYVAPLVARRVPCVVLAPSDLLRAQIDATRRALDDDDDDEADQQTNNNAAARRARFLDVVYGGAPAMCVVTPRDALAAFRAVDEAGGRHNRTRPANGGGDAPQQRLCLVVDEADGLLRPLGRYASKGVKEQRTGRAPPGERVARRIVECHPDAQLVAASATVGRPLRRLLDQIIDRDVAVARATTETGAPTPPRRPDDDEISSSSSTPFFARKPGAPRAVSAPAALVAHLVAPFAAPRPKKDAPPKSKSGAEEPARPSKRHLLALREALAATRPRRALVALADDDADLDRVVRELRGDAWPACRLDPQTLLAGPDTTNTGAGRRRGEVLVAPMRGLRGLDVRDLDLVLLLGKPGSPDEYLHVAGRAGRASRAGVALTVAPYHETKVLRSWATQLDVRFIDVPEISLLPPVADLLDDDESEVSSSSSSEEQKAEASPGAGDHRVGVVGLEPA